jgi:PAS domain S-box-containing protein
MVGRAFKPDGANEALRESEERFRSVFEYAAVGIFRVGLDGRFLEANRAFARITGYTEEELLRLHFSDLTCPEDLATSVEWLASLRTGKVATYQMEKRYRRKDEGIVWVSLSVGLARDSSGRPSYFSAVAEDITARKRAEEAMRESEERFRAFVTASSDVVYRMSPDWNELRELHGREFAPDGDARLRGWLERFIHPEDRPQVLAMIDESIRNRSIFQLEHRVLHGDGSVGWNSSRAMPVVGADGAILEWFGATSDITARKRVEEALREREGLLQLCVDHAPAAVAMFDRDMRYLVASRRFLADFKVGSEDVLGRSHYEVFPDVPERWKEIHRRCLAGAVESCDEDPFPRADGTLDWVKWEIHPWYTAAGGIGGIIMFTEVITERKRSLEALRESEDRFRLLVQGVQDCAIYMLAPDGTVTSWSAAAERIFGYREDEIVGQHRRVFFTKEDVAAGRQQQIFGEAESNGHAEVELWRIRKDGSRFWANVLVTALRDDRGGLRGFAIVTRDFTERKRAETELREGAERLRASEAALREADREKTRFLATLSHELRNPLAPIRNSLYIMERATPGGEQATRAQATIHRQIGQMTGLIDDLLDVTRIAHGKIQLRRERLDLDELAHRTAEDHRAVFAKGDVRLEVLPSPAKVWVKGDRVRLAQVIGNLLQNAAKFTPPGGKAVLSVESSPASDHAILTVRDTGSGIGPEMLPRLFQAFAQADATLDRSKGGLGLGLALVKDLVELHGGSVSAASDGEGKGATFTIAFPLDVSAPRNTAAQSGLGGAAPRRVLLIEDNEDAASTLREVLELDAHVVEVASSGPEGLEKARAFRPDVVLCDLGLPEMDGYEVARSMRSDPGTAGVGLIALSGYAQPEDVEKARQAGFDAHLAKPATVESLERTMARIGDERTGAAWIAQRAPSPRASASKSSREP